MPKIFNVFFIGVSVFLCFCTVVAEEIPSICSKDKPIDIYGKVKDVIKSPDIMVDSELWLFSAKRYKYSCATVKQIPLGNITITEENDEHRCWNFVPISECRPYKYLQCLRSQQDEPGKICDMGYSKFGQHRTPDRFIANTKKWDEWEMGNHVSGVEYDLRWVLVVSEDNIDGQGKYSLHDGRHRASWLYDRCGANYTVNALVVNDWEEIHRNFERCEMIAPKNEKPSRFSRFCTVIQRWWQRCEKSDENVRKDL